MIQRNQELTTQTVPDEKLFKLFKTISEMKIAGSIYLDIIDGAYYSLQLESCVLLITAKENAKHYGTCNIFDEEGAEEISAVLRDFNESN